MSNHDDKCEATYHDICHCEKRTLQRGLYEAASDCKRLEALVKTVVKERDETRRELAVAWELLTETKRDLRIAAKCMNPLTPVFRQFNDTADRIDAFLAAHAQSAAALDAWARRHHRLEADARRETP
jgi:hypothetical protein